MAEVPGVVEPRAKRAKPGRKAEAQRQKTFDFADDGDARLPPLRLLNPSPRDRAQGMSERSLRQNAEMLASVLEDFGVKGEIVKVRPGPVVTLYVLKPAPGTKTSRYRAFGRHRPVHGGLKRPRRRRSRPQRDRYRALQRDPRNGRLP